MTTTETTNPKQRLSDQIEQAKAEARANPTTIQLTPPQRAALAIRDWLAHLSAAWFIHTGNA